MADTPPRRRRMPRNDGDDGPSLSPPPSVKVPAGEEVPVVDADVEQLDELPAVQDGQPRAHLNPALLSDELDTPAEEAPSVQTEETSSADPMDELLDELADDDPAPVEPPKREEPPAPVEVAEEPAPEPSPPEPDLVLDEEPDLVLDEEPARSNVPPPPPPPTFDDDELSGNEDFWATIRERSEEDLPPSFDEDDEPDEEEHLVPAVEVEADADDEEFLTPVQDLDSLLAADSLDEDEEEDEDEEKIHAAARRLIFSAEPFLSIISPNLSDDVDELNHVLSAFADLQPGQHAIVRADARIFPDYKSMSSQWLAHRRNPEEVNPLEQKKAGKTIFSWLGYGLRRLWFEANKAGQAPGGTEPPLAPGKKGGAKPLPLSLVSDEEKQAWNDAKLKARDSRHFEVDLRVAVIGPKADADELERLADEAAAGFESYATEHQELVAMPADGYDTLIGFMGARADDIPSLTLSAAELGEIARVPDALTQPLGVSVKRSLFRHLHLHNPLTCDNPLDPGDNLIPIGLLNPKSDDRRVICMRNEDLDKHWFHAGRTGTGKSELMLWMILGVAKSKDHDGNPFPLVVIDPHGKLVRDATRMLILRCPERIKDMVICDLGAADSHPVALNPLDVHSREEVESAVNSVMEMMASHMALGDGAPRAKAYAQLALTALCEANVQIADPETKCTLLHVMDFFMDPTFRRLVCDICPNPSVRESFDPEHGQFELLTDKGQVDISMPIVRAITPLKTSEGFGAVFSAGENKLDFTKLISQNKIVLVQLGRFQDSSNTGKLIGSLILPWLLGSMTQFGRREDEKTGEVVGSGCRVFVDEGPTMLNPDSTEPLLAEARKYDVGLVIASQYIEQFPKSLVDAIKANTGSKLVLALDKEPAKALVSSIDPEGKDVRPENIARLPNFHFYASVYQEEGKSNPFSAACLPMIVPKGTRLDEEQEALLEEVKRRSWAAVCNDRDLMAEKRMRGNDDLKAALNHIWREKQARQTGPETTDLGIEDGSDAEWGGWGSV